MEDNGKYLRLFGTLFFTFIALVTAFILLMLGLRFFFGLLRFLPWFTYVYMVFIMMVPATLFISIFIIYARRTRSHPSKPTRIISYIIFAVALILWPVVFIRAVMFLSKQVYNGIDRYYSYDMIFLAANVACLFLVGVMQAFASEKETDWMDRNVNNPSDDSV